MQGLDEGPEGPTFRLPDGRAVVEHVEPARPYRIPPEGAGRVTGVFRLTRDDLWTLTVEGPTGPETLEVTADHPLWSERRQTWVPYASG